jgi:hypothetical protein
MRTGFIKIGELTELTSDSIESVESVFADADINERFSKFAQTLKRIAPKADEFLYFSAIFMHAAEAALVNPDGSRKLTSAGEQINAHWEKKDESLFWVCNDPSVKPYKNNNGDIFREEALLQSFKDFVGKPVCVNHRSSDVDAIRGIILDAYYDRKHKRVIGLCALDKVSYPDLARGITSGYKNSVSMGTAVGIAQCYDCGQRARTERDFCVHMRTKSCYGEINEMLSPLEISLVASPADTKAKIRTIIAAANQIHSRLSDQEKEFTKLSDHSALNEEQTRKLKELENDLKNASDKLAELKSVIEQEESSEKTVQAPYGQSSGTYAEPNNEVNQSFGLNLPERFSANNNALNNEALLVELNNLKLAMEQKLGNLETVLNNFKEETMSDKGVPMDKSAYFQGAGGVNEPTPGQKKYPVDPKNEECRIKEDKQMNGQPPFPDVGSVDGMHPSPASVDPKDELERKKMLARAEQEQRKLRRDAALQKAKENLMSQHKEGYWLGGGGVNEPEPKKVKYDIDPLENKLRLKEDKQMVGQKPFPDVGDVDGLHPSPLSADEKDELERKKMLQRASLKAKFVRVANTDGTDNQGDSAWQVFTKNDEGEKLVFTASVNEISGGRSDALFDVIATKEFGTKLLDKIRNEGFAKAASIYKKSQAVAGPGAMPGAPPDATGPGPVPAMDAAPPLDAGMLESKPEDKGGKGDPKETALRLAEQVQNDASDLSEAVKELTGEQAEMGDMQENLEALPKAASKMLMPLHTMRKELNAGLMSGMKKSVAELTEHKEELELIANIVDAGAGINKDYINTIVEDAFEDAKKALTDARALKQAYQKYMRGTMGLLKKAKEAEEEALLAFANDTTSTDESSTSTEDKSDANDMSSSDMSSANAVDDVGLIDDLNDHSEPEFDTMHELGEGMDAYEDEDALKGEEEDEHDDLPELEPEETLPRMDTNDVMVDLPPGAQIPTGAKAPAQTPGAPMKAASFDLTTKEGRTAYRAKLAADATGKQETGEVQDMAHCKFTDMLDKSEGLANGQTKLDTKPSDSLGKVETVVEVNKQMMDVAKAPPKVRKEAERLDQLIAEGSVSVGDLDKLVAEGLDSEVVKYWRQYYGEAGKEGSDFAKMLTTETMKAKAEEELKTYKIKLARSYELAYDMVRRGLLSDDRIAVSAQVDEIMQWNDEAFDSMKRVIAKHAPTSLSKTASIPQVGLGTDDSSVRPQSNDFQSELDRAFSGRKY